jgi:hypothetical protein
MVSEEEVTRQKIKGKSKGQGGMRKSALPFLFRDSALAFLYVIQ